MVAAQSVVRKAEPVLALAHTTALALRSLHRPGIDRLARGLPVA
jgi:hypothetical protein